MNLLFAGRNSFRSDASDREFGLQNRSNEIAHEEDSLPMLDAKMYLDSETELAILFL